MRTPHALIFAVGDELVDGRRLDANGRYVTHVLESLGCEIDGRLLTPDREDRIAAMLAAGLAGGPDVLIVSGGLGLAEDDRTRDAVARATGRPLVVDPAVREKIAGRYRDWGRELPAGVDRLAMIPEGGRAIPNPIAVACGFTVEHERTLLVALPGVPRQLKAMFERAVLPVLRDRLSGTWPVRTAAIRVVGLAESEVDGLVREVVRRQPQARASLMTTAGEVEVRVGVRAEAEDEAEATLERLLAELSATLGPHAYGRDRDSLVSVVAGLLRHRRLTLGVAESCTGGLLARAITDLPGVSDVFAGGIVAYGNAQKRTLLDVSDELLETCGAVSAEVCLAMVRGAMRRLEVGAAIATTGIAGPGGGSADKPVGLVYVGTGTPDGERVTRHLLTGDREAIRRWAVKISLDRLRRELAGLPATGEPVEAGARG
ncbi:MAG: competence/damage-inducible protein A [Acidobacteriota bacterium]